MKIGAGDPETQADALADFLAQHADHAKGFKTDYPGGLGSGRVAIKCKGCGARIERTSEGTHELSGEPLAPPPPPRRRLPSTRSKQESKVASEAPALEAGPRPTPAPPPPRRKKVKRTGEPSAAKGGPARRRGALTIALAAIAVASLLFVVLRVTGGDDGSSDQGATPPAQPPIQSQSAVPAQQSAKPQTISGDGYSFRLPAGWQRSVRDGAILLAPRASTGVDQRLYYDGESGLSLDQMVASTTELLRRDHPDAKITTPSSSKPGRAAIEATYPGGSSEATIIAKGSANLLLVSEISNGAAAADRSAAESVVRSLEIR